MSRFGTMCSSCGLCCHSQILCEKCAISTLKGNGLKISLLPEIKDLSYKKTSSVDPWGSSDLYWKIKELEEDEKNWRTHDDE